MKHERVALVITRMDWGGSTDIVRTLFEGLIARGFRCTLISGPTRHPTPRTRAFLERHKEQIVIIPSLTRDIHPVKDVAALFGLLRLFRMGHFDIVHTHTAKAGALGRLAACFARVKVVIHTPHGHNFYGYFGPLMSRGIVAIERLTARSTDAIVALTDLERRDYCTFLVAGGDKTVLIRQGLTLDDFRDRPGDKEQLRQSLGIASDAPVVGFIGRLEHVKGPDLFIKAASVVTGHLPQARFLVAGEGGMRRQLEHQARQLGIHERVVFAGWRQDVPALLRMVDLLIVPSRNEAVGMVLIEAAAAGVASIATKVGGIPEVAREGVTALLVEPEDEAALAHAIIELLGDDKRRRTMGSAAQAWVKERYLPEVMVEAHAALYERLIAQKGDAARL